MKIKEAIECLNSYIECSSEQWGISISEKDALEIKSIIELLQRGEKYKKMWRKFKGKYKNCMLNYHGDDREFQISMEKDWFVDLKMDKFKKEYFPKEK